jgi:hypothetical protein
MYNVYESIIYAWGIEGHKTGGYHQKKNEKFKARFEGESPWGLSEDLKLEAFRLELKRKLSKKKLSGGIGC